MVTSKRKKAKRAKKVASRSQKAVATKRTAKKAKKSPGTTHATGSGPSELHPRLREQALRSDRSTFPDNFHALYDRGFRASRGIAAVERRAPKRLAKELKGADIQYDDATQLPNLVITTPPSRRLS